MKKMVTLLLFLLLLAAAMSTPVTPAYAAEPLHEDFVSTKTNEQTLPSACVVGDTLYVIKGSRIVAFSAPDTAPVTVFDLSSFPKISETDYQRLLLAGDGSRLYLLYPYMGVLYEVTAEGLAEVVHLDISQIGQAGRGGKRLVMFSWPVISGDHLYLLSLDPVEYGSMDMYRFSLKDGKAELVTPPGVELMEIAPYKDGKLLIRNANNGNVLIFDPAVKQVTNTLAKLTHGDGSVAYDGKTDELYYLSETRLMKHGKKPEFLDRVPISGASDAKYAALWHGHYVVLAGSGLYLCQTEGGQTAVNDQVLTIWVNSGIADSQIVNEFRLEYPDIMVDVIRADDEDTLERLTTENLSGNSSIDLFLMPSDLIDHREIFSRGFAAPIHSEKLQGNVREMYPQVQEMLLQGDQLLGYPEGLMVSYFTVRPELLAQSGLGDIPETWEEYCDMLLLWYDLYAEDHPGFAFNEYQTAQQQQQYLLRYLIRQYVRTYATDDAPISFNTPAFRSLMERLAALSAWDGVEEDVTSEQSVFVTSNVISPFIRMLNPSSIGEESILPPVFEAGDTPVFSADLMYFIINPHSRHYDDAVTFLEFYSDHISLPERYALYPGYNELVEEDTYPHRIKAINDQVTLSKNVIQREEAFLASVSEHYAAYYPDDYALRLEIIAYHEDAIAQAEAERVQVEAKRYVCSADSIAEYRRVAACMSFQNGPAALKITETIGANSILMKYFDGAATLDQVLEELDRKILMMYYEAQ